MITSNLKSAQESHMFDLGYVVTMSGHIDSYGDFIASGVVNEPIACGLKTDLSSERYGQVIMAGADAIVRLPIGTVINPSDRFTITKRFGEAITPETYEVVGLVTRGPSAIQAKLKRYDGD